ncbi:ABC transporter ATP-binding protein, partial [Azonexus hydrophilus]|uniref:ABC transporter ATP-binding protein n=1 Tax=Azonexus hydrophilus TaxID=418702 RepID=UPI0024908728
MSLLEVKDLSIHFGGVKAVQNVSFSIDSGIVYSVIGPNGAGKTTLFNLITGVYTPTSGEIRLDGEIIQGKSPDELARRGMARTFQNLQICMNMSAIENVMVGAHLRLDRNLFKAMLRLPALKRRDEALREEAAGLMEFVGLGEYVGARADAGFLHHHHAGLGAGDRGVSGPGACRRPGPARGAGGGRRRRAG